MMSSQGTELAPSSVGVPELKQHLIARFGVPPEDAADYAKAALVLSDNREFERRLALISQCLASAEQDIKQNISKLKGDHKIYQTGLYGVNNADNAFGRTIQVVAGKLGWSAQHNVVLSDNIPESQIKKYINGKIIWRDAISVPHGEFIHGIQWLVIYTVIGSKTPELYAKSVNYKSDKKLKVAAMGGNNGEDYVTLWNYLVDCSEWNRSRPREDIDWKESLLTETCRSPHKATKVLKGLAKEGPKAPWAATALKDYKKKFEAAAPRVFAMPGAKYKTESLNWMDQDIAKTQGFLCKENDEKGRSGIYIRKNEISILMKQLGLKEKTYQLPIEELR